MAKTFESELDIPKSPKQTSNDYKYLGKRIIKAKDYLPAKRTLDADYNRPVYIIGD